MTNVASITLMVNSTIAVLICPPLRFGEPPFGPVPPTPEVEDSTAIQLGSATVTKLARFVTIQRVCKFSAQLSPITRLIVRAPA